TQRGKRKLLLDGHIYRLDRKNDHGTEQWRCAKKQCRGRVHIQSTKDDYNGKGYFNAFPLSNDDITLVSSHNHSSEPGKAEAAVIVDQLRSTAKNNISQTPKEIVDRLLRTVTEAAVQNLPSVTAMQRSIQRRRQKSLTNRLLIASATSMTSCSEHEQILSIIDSSAFHSIYLNINDEQISSTLELNNLKRSQIIITSEENIKELEQADIWFITIFNEVKNDYFKSICIIHIVDDSNLKPCLYALLKMSNIEHYEKLISTLFKPPNNNFQPKYFITNLDKLLIHVLTKYFPETQIKICLTFLNQELIKYAQNIHSEIQCHTQDEQKVIKFLLALAFIPLPDVTMVFEALQELCPSSFEDICIGRLRPNGYRSQPLYALKLWNWADCITMNSLSTVCAQIKQWDNMFKTSMTTSHRSSYKIIRTIQQLHHHYQNTYHAQQNNSLVSRNSIIANYCTQKFYQHVQSYGTIDFQLFLSNLAPYLPV
ncbi:unnamed protein product, partial [Didymodactylos carnosus]